MGWQPSDRPILCLVVDRANGRQPLDQAVRAAIDGGVDWVQLRDRTLEGRVLHAWAKQLAERAAGATLIVNRRLDLALCFGAGAHLGFDAVAPQDASTLLGPDVLVGVSCHSAEEVAEAAAAGADYAHLAPVFDPLSKPASRPALGTGVLSAAAHAGIPVIAQGGITAANASSVIRAGAAGVAVTGSLLSAANPQEAAAGLRQALDG